jgi:hypothetical protein
VAAVWRSIPETTGTLRVYKIIMRLAVGRRGQTVPARVRFKMVSMVVQAVVAEDRARQLPVVLELLVWAIAVVRTFKAEFSALVAAAGQMPLVVTQLQQTAAMVETD